MSRSHRRLTVLAAALAASLTLRGFYAAHPTWLCGALVSVPAATATCSSRSWIEGPASRVIDVSKRAFEWLEAPSRGVVDVRHYRLDV